MKHASGCGNVGTYLNRVTELEMYMQNQYTQTTSQHTAAN